MVVGIVIPAFCEGQTRSVYPLSQQLKRFPKVGVWVFCWCFLVWFFLLFFFFNKDFGPDLQMA